MPRVGTLSSANVAAVTNPVLEAKGLRVDVDGVPKVDSLTLTTTGDRVLVLAGPGALFQASAGMVQPRHGEILVDGLSPRSAVEQRLMASAPLDPPLPPSWKLREYVLWSARLAGLSKGDADAASVDVIDRLKLQALASMRLRLVATPARRAVVVAAALATGATTLLLEDPLRGLPEDAARGLARALVRATAGLRTVIFAARASLSSPLSSTPTRRSSSTAARLWGRGRPPRSPPATGRTRFACTGGGRLR